MNKVSIIIPVHNRLNITQNGLNSLNLALENYRRKGEKELTIEIVVVDDGSKDGTADWISLNYPEIVVIRGDGDLWWSGAINEGLRYVLTSTNSNYVLLWNDDLKCEISYFIELANAISNKSLKDVILVSKVLWQHDPSVLFNFGCYYSKSRGKISVNGYNQLDGKSYGKPTRVDCSGGMGTLIPMPVIHEVGLFDSNNFPQYFGDIDYFLRAKKKGFSAFAIPQLRVYNDLESTGKKKIRDLADLYVFLFSNRSNMNLKQNFKFNRIHSNTLMSWCLFVLRMVRNIIRAI